MRHWALLVVALVALPANAGAGVYGYSTYGEPPVLLRFDLTAGLVEFVGGVGEDHYISGLAFTSDGLLYGIDPFGDRLMLIDPSTGVGTFVGSLRIDVGSHADLTGGKGGELWLLDDTTSRLYRVDRTTGSQRRWRGASSAGEVSCTRPREKRE